MNLLPIGGIVRDNYYYTYSLRDIYLGRILFKNKISLA